MQVLPTLKTLQQQNTVKSKANSDQKGIAMSQAAADETAIVDEMPTPRSPEEKKKAEVSVVEDD